MGICYTRNDFPFTTTRGPLLPLLPLLPLPFHRCKALQSHSQDSVDGASEGNLCEGEYQGEEVGEDLVAVGLAEQGGR